MGYPVSCTPCYKTRQKRKDLKEVIAITGKKEVVVGLGLTTLGRHVVNESGLTQVLIVGCHVVKG